MIGTVEAVLQRTSPPDDLVPHVFTLEAGADDRLRRRRDAAGADGLRVRQHRHAARRVLAARRHSRRLFQHGGSARFASSCSATRSRAFAPSMSPRSAAPAGRPWSDLAPAREIRLVARTHRARRSRRSRPLFAARKAALRRRGHARGARGHRAADRPRTRATSRSCSRAPTSTAWSSISPISFRNRSARSTICRRTAWSFWTSRTRSKTTGTGITTDMQSARERQWERGEALDAELNTCPYAPLPDGDWRRIPR